MSFIYFIPLLGLYVFFRAVWPVCSRNEKTSFGILIALGTLFPYFVHYCAGGISSPTLDYSAMLAGDFLFICVVAATVVFLIRDLASLVCLVLRRPSLTKNRAMTSVLTIAIALYTATGMYHALTEPDVKKITIESESVPLALDGLTIAQLSDLHVANVFGEKRIRSIVRLTNELNPDLTVITGDFVDGTLEKRAGALAPLSGLKSRYGVYACEGNHEYYVNHSGWKHFFPSLGIHMLYNTHETIEINGARLTLLGLNDTVSAKFGLAGPDIEKALNSESGDYRIALIHQPRNAPEIADHHVDLMLSGHTHGGQTPLLSLIVRSVNNGFLRGRYVVTGEKTQNAMQLYVSSGTGLWTGFPMRVGTRNEITLITLKRK